jgi:hypothetical protein
MLAAALMLSAVPMILQVDSVNVVPVKGGLTIQVEGTATTPGWTNVRLELTSSKGGHLIYEMVGNAPEGIVAQVLSPVKVIATWKGRASKVRDVTVKARSNEKTVKIKK